MKDAKPCHHTLSEDVIYKEVVIIGNGPSGMVTSFMLAGNVPHLKQVPDDLPIDEMLKTRLSNIPTDQSLYDTDLEQLAEGLEGRSQNPMSLLMDNLLRPCADLGIQADSLIEWKFDIDKQVEHVVLGRGPVGGAWHTFPASVRTLSPAAWLSLPPHPALAPPGRVPARAVAAYCRRYVRLCNIQRYFRSGVVVTGVRRAGGAGGGCAARGCPLNARFCVTGYETRSGATVRYLCDAVVVACGGGDRANTVRASCRALHGLPSVATALARVRAGGGALVIGSGLSAADAVLAARALSLRVYHAHRRPAPALAVLAPDLYPDYCQVYKMMCDGPGGNHRDYVSLPEHDIVSVSDDGDGDADSVAPKRVTLCNTVTNETTEVTVNVIAVLVGTKPDLHFLQSDFNYLNMEETCQCQNKKHPNKRKIEDEPRCFLKNHWTYLKCVIGQSIQSCKSRYLNYSEINGNRAEGCEVEDCGSRDPSADGIGYGIDEKRPVDCRANPLAIDKTTHGMLHAPRGMYALGPPTADTFMRYIPGGALAIVADLHRQRKTSD